MQSMLLCIMAVYSLQHRRPLINYWQESFDGDSSISQSRFDDYVTHCMLCTANFISGHEDSLRITTEALSYSCVTRPRAFSALICQC